MSENKVSKIKLLSNNQVLDIAVDSSNILNAVPQFAVFTRMSTCLPYYICNKPLEELSTPQLGIQHYKRPMTTENGIESLENSSVEKYNLLASWKPQNEAGQPHYVFDNLETTINDLEDTGNAIARDNNVKVTLEFTPEYSSEGVLIGFNTQYPQNVIFNWEYEDTVSMGNYHYLHVNPFFELPTDKVSINDTQYTITNTHTTEFSGYFYVVDEENHPVYLLEAESSDSSLFMLKDFPNME